MAFANDPTDPANMTPDERLAEVAAILAEGVLRLRSRVVVPDPEAAVINPVESEESAGFDLDVPSETRLNGQRG